MLRAALTRATMSVCSASASESPDGVRGGLGAASRGGLPSKPYLARSACGDPGTTSQRWNASRTKLQQGRPTPQTVKDHLGEPQFHMAGQHVFQAFKYVVVVGMFVLPLFLRTCWIL